jgi:chromosome segregation ATPase
MTTIEEVKAKFSSVEKINQSLKDELIRTEEQLKSAKDSYDKAVSKLFELTDKDTIEDARVYISQLREEYENKLNDLNDKLSEYLDKDGE